MEEIIKTYDKNKHEFELRLGHGKGLTPRSYHSILKRFDKQKSDEQSITLTCNNANNNRTTYYFDSKMKNVIKKEMEIKNKVREWKFKKYKITISEEKKAINDDSEEINCFRFKKRTSFIQGDWKYDFTEVIDMPPNNGTTYTNWIDHLFNKIKKAKPMRYEIEIEFIGKQLTLNVLEQITKDVDKMMIIGEEGEIFKPLFLVGQSIIETKPVSLEKKDLKKVFDGSYSVTEKTDGKRTIIHISSNGVFYERHGHRGYKRLGFKTDAPMLWDTILDTEKTDSGIYYAFNILYSGGFETYKKKFKERYKLLVSVIKQIGLDQIKVKKFYFKNLHLACKKILSQKFDYEIDGLIFTPNDPNDKEYKWKPLDQLTFDFLVKFDPKAYIVGDYLRIHLYYGGFKDGKYQAILFRPPDANKNTYIACLPISDIKGTTIYSNGIPINNESIIEFKYNKNEPIVFKRWIAYRVREDKTKYYIEMKKEGKFGGPNSEESVMGNWRIHQNPVTESDLIKQK